MKKKLYLVLLGILVTTSSIASEHLNKLYFGLGYNYHIASAKSFYDNIIPVAGQMLSPKKFNAPQIFFGSNWEDYGLEIGANFIKPKEHFTVASITGIYVPEAKIAVTSTNYYADAIGYHPLSQKLSLVGRLGLSYLRTSVTAKQYGALGNQIKHSVEHYGIRIGIGGQLALSRHLFTRIEAITQTGNKILNNLKTCGVNIMYMH